MKLIRVFSTLALRLALLSLIAAAFVWLTSVYGGPVRSPRLPEPEWLEEREHHPSEPQVSQLLEFIGEFMVVAVAGRITLRLRLSPTSRSEGQMVLLDLHTRTTRTMVKLEGPAGYLPDHPEQTVS